MIRVTLFTIAAVVTLLAIMLLFSVLVPVHAHDMDAPNAPWFNRLTNKYNMDCCAQHGGDPLNWDCQQLDPAHIRTTIGPTQYLQDSHLWRRGDNKWHDIPEDLWVDQRKNGPNPTGEFVVCIHWWGAADHATVLCASKPAGM